MYSQGVGGPRGGHGDHRGGVDGVALRGAVAVHGSDFRDHRVGVHRKFRRESLKYIQCVARNMYTEK